MASYSVFKNHHASDTNAPDTNGLVNPSGTNYSDIWQGHDTDGYGLTVFYSGTLTGTFTLWMTDKDVPTVADDTDWVQDTSFSPTNPAGAAGKFRDDVWNGKARYKRLKYVQSSGTGTITAYVHLPRTSK